MKRIAIAATFALLAGISTEMAAQIPGAKIPPRKDDHFQRNLTVYRVDLSEKINQPLVMGESRELYANSELSHRDGVVAALLNGLKSGKYLAYDVDDLKQVLTYDEVMAKAERQYGVNTDSEFEDSEPGELCDDCPFVEEEDDFFDNSGTAGSEFEDGNIPTYAYETNIEIISNRIFDKNRSDIVNDIQYIRLVWVDPGETLPDQNFVCIKFSEALEVLEDCQWKNVHNDAEYRNMREIFELQLMNKYLTHVSGRGIRTLPESAYRADQLTEFEHNLWSY